MTRTGTVARRGTTLALLAALTLAAVPMGQALAAPLTATTRASTAKASTATPIRRNASPLQLQQPSALSPESTPTVGRHSSGAAKLPPAPAVRRKGSQAAPLHVASLHLTLPSFPQPARTSSAALPAVSTTFVVGGSCASGTNEASIQAALSAAHAGDTIDICPGTYPVQGNSLIFTHAYQVNKANLTIQGIGSGVVIDASPVSPASVGVAFLLLGVGDTLNKLTLENATGSDNPSDGIFGIGVLSLALNQTITDVSLINNNVGVYISGLTNTRLQAVVENTNPVTNRQSIGLWVDGAAANAIVGDDAGSNHSIFSYNLFGPSDGSYLDHGARLTATNTLFESNGRHGLVAPTGSGPHLSLIGGDANNNSVDGLLFAGGGSLTTNGTSFNNEGNRGVLIGTSDSNDSPTYVSLTDGSASNDVNGVEVTSDTPTTISIDGTTLSNTPIMALPFSPRCRSIPALAASAM